MYIYYHIYGHFLADPFIHLHLARHDGSCQFFIENDKQPTAKYVFGFFFYFPFPFRKKQKTVGEIQHACNCLLRPRILCCSGKLPRYLEGAQLVIDVLLGELVL